MSLQLKFPSSFISKSDFDRLFYKPGLLPDGTLQIDHFLNNQIGFNENHLHRIRNAFKSFKREFLFANSLLVVVLFIIFFVPKRILKLRTLLPRYIDTYSKRLLDIIGSVFGLVVSSGLFFWLPYLIRIDSKGKVIYKQKRVGLNRRNGDRRKISLQVPFERRKGDRRQENLKGQPFKIYKFRSMKENAEKDTGPTWAKDNDPRSTRVGKVMRLLHIDEIPQFVNVLKGDMSLVGPRPERPEIISQLEKTIPKYTKRLECKPGITGLAQISCGSDTQLSDVSRKLDYDIDYIQKRNLLVDIIILLSTFKVVSAPGAEINNVRLKRFIKVS